MSKVALTRAAFASLVAALSCLLSCSSPPPPARLSIEAGYRASIHDPESRGDALEQLSTLDVVQRAPGKFADLAAEIVDSPRSPSPVKLDILRALGPTVRQRILEQLKNSPAAKPEVQALGLEDTLKFIASDPDPAVAQVMVRAIKSEDLPVQKFALDWLAEHAAATRETLNLLKTQESWIACEPSIRLAARMADAKTVEEVVQFCDGWIAPRLKANPGIDTTAFVEPAGAQVETPTTFEETQYLEEAAVTYIDYLDARQEIRPADMERVRRLSSKDASKERIDAAAKFLLHHSSNAAEIRSTLEATLDLEARTCTASVERIVGSGMPARETIREYLQGILLSTQKPDDRATCAALALVALQGEVPKSVQLPLLRHTLGYLAAHILRSMPEGKVTPRPSLVEQDRYNALPLWHVFADSLPKAIPDIDVVKPSVLPLFKAGRETAGIELAVRILGAYGTKAQEFRAPIAKELPTTASTAVRALAAIDGDVRALATFEAPQISRLIMGREYADAEKAKVRDVLKAAIGRGDPEATKVIRKLLTATASSGDATETAGYLQLLYGFSPLGIGKPQEMDTLLARKPSPEDRDFSSGLVSLLAVNPDWIDAATVPRIVTHLSNGTRIFFTYAAEDKVLSNLWSHLHAQTAPAAVPKEVLRDAAFAAAVNVRWDGPFFERNAFVGKEAIAPLIPMMEKCTSFTVEYRTGLRHFAHVLGRGDPEMEYLLSLLCRAKPLDDTAYAYERVPPPAFGVLANFWRRANAAQSRSVRDALSDTIARVIAGAPAGKISAEAGVLHQLADEMAVVKDRNAPLVRDAAQRGNSASSTWLLIGALHPAIYLLLIAWYPRSRRVQSLFLFSPVGRKLIGLWYIDVLIKQFPPIRERLLRPFSQALTAGAISRSSNADVPYFEDVWLQKKPDGKPLRPSDLAKSQEGVRFIEGASGSGKTRLIQFLAQASRNPWVWLPAVECAGGVAEAIKDRMHGRLVEGDFVEAVVHLGGLEVYIDGLNEAPAEARSAILTFVRRFRGAKVTIATQPLRTSLETGATWYEMLPLTLEQSRQFLLSCIQAEAVLRKRDPQPLLEAAETYLASIVPNSTTSSRTVPPVEALANPLDLTAMASLIARGEHPHWWNLRGQQIDAAAAEYARTSAGMPFPMKRVSEIAYEQVLQPEKPVLASEIGRVVAVLLDFRLMIQLPLEEHLGAAAPEYRFRHERICDAFVSHHFREHIESLGEKHATDPRFRGVYVYLVQELEFEGAKKLVDVVVARASASHDHSVSDDMVIALQRLHRRDLP